MSGSVKFLASLDTLTPKHLMDAVRIIGHALPPTESLQAALSAPGRELSDRGPWRDFDAGHSVAHKIAVTTLCTLSASLGDALRRCVIAACGPAAHTSDSLLPGPYAHLALVTPVSLRICNNPLASSAALALGMPALRDTPGLKPFRLTQREEEKHNAARLFVQDLTRVLACVVARAVAVAGTFGDLGNYFLLDLSLALVDLWNGPLVATHSPTVAPLVQLLLSASAMQMVHTPTTTTTRGDVWTEEKLVCVLAQAGLAACALARHWPTTWPCAEYEPTEAEYLADRGFYPENIGAVKRGMKAFVPFLKGYRNSPYLPRSHQDTCKDVSRWLKDMLPKIPAITASSPQADKDMFVYARMRPVGL